MEAITSYPNLTTSKIKVRRITAAPEFRATTCFMSQYWVWVSDAANESTFTLSGVSQLLLSKVSLSYFILFLPCGAFRVRFDGHSSKLVILCYFNSAAENNLFVFYPVKIIQNFEPNIKFLSE